MIWNEIWVILFEIYLYESFTFCRLVCVCVFCRELQDNLVRSTCAGKCLTLMLMRMCCYNNNRSKQTESLNCNCNTSYNLTELEQSLVSTFINSCSSSSNQFLYTSTLKTPEKIILFVARSCNQACSGLARVFSSALISIHQRPKACRLFRHVKKC